MEKKRTKMLAALIACCFGFAALLAGCGGQGGGNAAPASDGSSSAAGSAPAPAGSGQVLELKFAHVMSANHIQHTEVMQPFADEVEQLTEGRVIVTIYPGSALGKAEDQFNAAATGIADLAYGVQGYTPGKFPLTSVMTLPFQASSAMNATNTLWNLYQNIPEIQAEYDGTEVLYLWTNEPSQILTSKKQVKTLEDLKGLKLRSPDTALNSVIEAWGATPVNMPLPDVFDAMQKGVVDGALVDLTALNDFNLADVTKYVAVVNVSTTPFYVVANPTSWNKIEAADKEKINAILGKNMADKAASAWGISMKEGLSKAEANGIEIYNVPDSELARWAAEVDSLIQAWINDNEAKGLPAQKVYDEVQKLKNQ